MRLKNRSVIITGGAQGLGEGIARRLASEGASVAIADRNGALAQEVADDLKRQNYSALAVTVDVSERKQVDVDEDNFNSIMRVNAWGVMLGTQEAARQMMAQGTGGKIINTASIAGRQGYAEFAPYCASKASVISLTQAAAREFAKHKITVNAFAPGVVVTPLWDGLEQDMIDKGVIKEKGEFINSFSSSILLGFPSKPHDLAGIAAFLASSDSDYITGQVIMSDGGMILV